MGGRMADISALQLIRHFENFREKAYQDSAGIWTVGWGFTYNVLLVGESTMITRKVADILLAHLVTHTEESVRGLAINLKACELAAISALIYNVGFSKFIKSRCYQYLLDGDVGRAMPEWLDFCHDCGRVELGLIKRRATEIAVYLGETFEFAMGSA